jgi:hypothetical protein
MNSFASGVADLRCSTFHLLSSAVPTEQIDECKWGVISFLSWSNMAILFAH